MGWAGSVVCGGLGTQFTLLPWGGCISVCWTTLAWGRDDESSVNQCFLFLLMILF